MGLCHRKVPDRSDLVVLSLLASEISRQELWHQPVQTESARYRRLRDRRRRQCWWWLVIINAHQAWLDGQSRAEDGNADLRVLCRAGYFRGVCYEHVDGRAADCAGG